MFPNFKSLSQREQKRRSLIRQTELDLENDAAKRQAYAEAMWADDVEKNKIKLSANKTEMATGTDGSITGIVSGIRRGQEPPSSSSGSNQIDPTVRSVLNGIIDQISGSTTPQSSGGPSGVFSASSVSSSAPGASPSIVNNASVSSEIDPTVRSVLNSIIDRVEQRTQSSASRVSSSNENGEDIGDVNDSVSDIDDREEEEDEEATQLHSRAFLKALYIEYPELATAQYQVVRKGKDLPDRSYVLSKDAIVYNKRNRKPARRDIVASVDWIKTALYVESLLEKDGSNVLREKMGMEGEDRDAPYTNFLKRSAKGQKRSLAEIKRLKPYLEATRGTDTSDDQNSSYETIRELYVENRDKFDRLGVNAIDFNKDIIQGFKIVLNKDGSNLILIKNSSNKLIHNPSAAKKVSWVYTLQYLLERVANINTSIRTPRDWQTQADHTTDTGISLQVDVDMDAKNIIERIYATVPWMDTLEIKPIQNYKDGPKKSESYHFGDNLSFYTNKTNKRVSGKALEDLSRQINWKLTLNGILQTLATYDQLLYDVQESSELSSEDNALIEAQRKQIGSVIREFKIKATTDEAFTHTFGRGFSGPIMLKGRGLMGAGYTCKNLKDIEGSGTASDLKYKRLGSKFIRVGDLSKNRLKLVFPNRTAIYPLRDISPELSSLINKLVFDKDIDQQIYGKLTIEDKKIFCEILKATHLQHQFSNPIGDPIETLKAEFDKLRGQVLLGNNNPDLIRELKTLTVDLYGQKLISESEFKDVLLNL